jgi:6,7-dimethyl-8-ribityllumazine synthase
MPASSQIAIVIGSFHRRQAEIMLESALDTAATHGLMVTDPVWVPGSMEKPLALKRLLLEPSVDGAVVLGIIEQGQTAHGRVMGQAVINAILNLQLDLMKPIGVGILGPEIQPGQIQERLVPYACDAVLAVHTMLGSPGNSS